MYPHTPTPYQTSKSSPTSAADRAAALQDVLREAPRVDTAGREAVLAWAAALQALGLYLFPVQAGAKLPATAHGYKDGTTDPEALAAMYAQGMNLGVWLGASGLVVIDADTPAEVEAYRAWWRSVARGATFPRPTVVTPGNQDGHHGGGHWWNVAEDVDLRETPEMDLAAPGAEDGSPTATAKTGPRYVLLPGSVRADAVDPAQPEYRVTGEVLYNRAGSRGVVSEVVRAGERRRVAAAQLRERNERYRERTALGGGAIEEWTEATTWAEIMEPHGWEIVSSLAGCGCENWSRPGKTDGSKSATAHESYTCTAGIGTALKVFSDNAAPLVPVRDGGQGAYSKLAAYAALDHDGDVRAAMEDLELETHTGQFLNPADIDPDTWPEGWADKWELATDTDTDSETPTGVLSSGRRAYLGRQDVAAVLSGDLPRLQATMWERTDGACLLYAGKTHSVHGESESGKSFIIQALAAEEIKAGNQVLYLDYEDALDTVAERLTDVMGVDPEDLAVGLDYWNPEPDPADGSLIHGMEDMCSGDYSLVVVDGVTDSLDLGGFNPNEGKDVARWHRTIPGRLAKETGAAVVVIDHVTKSTEGRGRMAIGSQTKMSSLSGAAYTVDVVEQPAPGKVGQLVLYVSKDRVGRVRAIAGKSGKDRKAEVATITVDSTSEVVEVRLDPPRGDTAPATADDGDGQGALVGVLDLFLDSLPEGARGLSATKQAYVVAAATGYGEPLTPTQLGEAWLAVAPQRSPGKKATREESMRRAGKQGALRHPGRGTTSWVAVEDSKIGREPMVRNAVAALRGALERADNSAV